MHLNIINELKRLNIISWYAILLALEKRWVTKKDIEDYSVYLLNFPDFYNDNVAILANALSYSDDEVKDQILQLCEEIQFNKNDETQKLKLAALCYLVNSKYSEEEQCNILQELYAEFDYPEDMRECSIYHNSKISPIKAMHLLIASLKKQILLHTKNPNENEENNAGEKGNEK
jgi:hypothetical protein